MAIKTYIDGGKQAITFNNDTQPVAVYVDGDLQENVSFVPDTVQGTGSVEYTSEYKKNHIEYEVQGTTIQDGTPTPEAPIPIQNANDNGMSVVLHGTNLATAEQFCENFARYAKGEFDGRECVNFRQDNEGKFVLDGGFKPNTQYTISFDAFREIAIGNDGGNDNIFYIDYTDGTRDGLRITIDVWKHYVLTTKQGKTVKSIGQLFADYRSRFYIDINTFMFQEGAVTAPVYEPYFRETIEIPTSIDVNGKNVPLIFTEYDKLTVDRLDNKVVYSQGSFTYSYTGEETGTYKLSVVSGNGNNYRSFLEYLNSEWGLKCVDNVGYCTHFKKARWNPLSAYGTYVTGIGDVIFRTDGKQTLDEFKAFLKEQYDNGTPVTIVKKRADSSVKNHDITNTDLGQALLNLATQNQTNYFEVQGNSNAPQTPIKFTFAKRGGRNENNNNT